jgi:hypothetical protein
LLVFLLRHYSSALRDFLKRFEFLVPQQDSPLSTNDQILSILQRYPNKELFLSKWRLAHTMYALSHSERIVRFLKRIINLLRSRDGQRALSMLDDNGWKSYATLIEFLKPFHGFQ